MFKNEYQGGPYFEVLSAQGKDPITKWKISGSTGISKIYDKDVKSYIYVLEGSSSTTRMQLPKDNKQLLTLIQRYLVIQVYIPLGQEFSIELGISDLCNNKRRMLLSTTQKEVSCTPLHARIPLVLMKRAIWLNLCLDLISLVGENWKGQTYRALESLIISANCRLRRVFTMRSQPPDTTDDDDLYGCGITNHGVLSSLPKSCLITHDIPYQTQVINMYKIRCAEIKGHNDITVKPAALLDIDSSRRKMSNGPGSSRNSNSSTASSRESSSTIRNKNVTPTRSFCGDADCSKSSSSVSPNERESGSKQGFSNKLLKRPHPPKEKTLRYKRNAYVKKMNRDLIRSSGNTDNVLHSATQKIVQSASSSADVQLLNDLSEKDNLNIDSSINNTTLFHAQRKEDNLEVFISLDSDFDVLSSNEEVELEIKKALSKISLVDTPINDFSSEMNKPINRISNSFFTKQNENTEDNVSVYLESLNNSGSNVIESVQTMLTFPPLEYMENNDQNCDIKKECTLSDTEERHLPLTTMRETFMISKAELISDEPTAKGSNSLRKSLEYEESDSDDFSKCRDHSRQDKVYLFASPPKFAPRRNVSPTNLEAYNDQYAVNSNISKVKDKRGGPRPEEDFVHSSSSDDYDEDIKQNLIRNSDTTSQQFSPSNSQTRMSISRKSLREIPISDARLSSMATKEYNPSKYCMEELNESFEAQMLASLKRQQVEEDSNLIHESQSGSLEQHVYGDDSLSSSSDETSTTLSTWRGPVPPIPSHHFQKEMRLSAIKSSSDPLSMSNPRDWAGVFSPPIVVPSECLSENNPSQILGSCTIQNHFLQGNRTQGDRHKRCDSCEEELDLLYDPCLNCYFDPKSCKYYELI